MKYEIRMIDLNGNVVASEQKEVKGFTVQVLKIVEKSQNEVLANMGFKGYCKIVAIPE